MAQLACARPVVSPLRATLAGLSATLVGIGLARFAYTPLVPAVIEAGWVSPGQAAYLGAANLIGYLAGALLARPLATRAPVAVLLRAMMLGASISFFASALPLSFAWLCLWRLVAGLAGGTLMVLAASSVLALVPAARRGLAGGVVFTGVGLGIAASGLLVPRLLPLGLTPTWLCLGVLASLFTLAAWHSWPAGRLDRGSDRPAPAAASRTLGALYVAYGLNAVALVPHMVFLVDFVARGLERGIGPGAQTWVIFGLGALIGPMLAGALADRIGAGSALRLGFLVQAAAIGWLALANDTLALAVSSLVVGAFVPGIVVLVLGKVRVLAGPDVRRQTAAWSLATTAFALGQAGGAAGFAALFEATGSYALLFQLSAGAVLLALIIDLIGGRRTNA